MREGLLWYDASNRSVVQKIDEAARRYQERFGRAANCCHVRSADGIQHPTLHVVANPTILPHHFWIGVDESLLPPGRSLRRR